MKKKTIKVNPPKLRKGQKCWLCKKEIKGSWCWNGHYWHEKCKDKDSAKRIKKYFAHESKIRSEGKNEKK